MGENLANVNTWYKRGLRPATSPGLLLWSSGTKAFSSEIKASLLCIAYLTVLLNPSPIMATVNVIEPTQIEDDVDNHLVNSPTNPGRCPCGWYIYTSNVCRHQYIQQPYKCGMKETPTGKIGFCKTPAPRHLILGTEVNESCKHC
jgi:hypothetical protein